MGLTRGGCCFEGLEKKPDWIPVETSAGFHPTTLHSLFFRNKNSGFIWAKMHPTVFSNLPFILVWPYRTSK